MTLKHLAIKQINPLSVAIGERFLMPTDHEVKDMAESIKAGGQLTPILVGFVTTKHYELVAGATRVLAFTRHLDKKTIRAEIVSGTPLEYKIAEITENLNRKNLTAEQKKEMRKRKIELERQHMAEVEPAKGGRGKKGGRREAARKEGISEPTARRRAAPKLRRTQQSDAVSAPEAAPEVNGNPAPAKVVNPPAPVTASAAIEKQKACCYLLVSEVRRIDRHVAPGTRSDFLERAIRALMKAENVP
jgi:hypothetical protein